MADAYKLEIGAREQFTLTTSVALDSNPIFFLKDWNGTLVRSVTGATSADGDYYAYSTLPTSRGWYTGNWYYVISANTYQADPFRVELVQMLTGEASGQYCTANDVLNLYKPLGETRQTNMEIDEVIRDVMNEIDARLAGLYSTPFATGVNSLPPLISTITKNLALVSILETRPNIEGNVAEWVQNRDKRYRGMLESVADGDVTLVLSGGTSLTATVPSDQAQVYHSMEGYTPTFNLLDFEDQEVDSDRLNDEADSLT